MSSHNTQGKQGGSTRRTTSRRTQQMSQGNVGHYADGHHVELTTDEEQAERERLYDEHAPWLFAILRSGAQQRGMGCQMDALLGELLPCPPDDQAGERKLPPNEEQHLRRQADARGDLLHRLTDTFERNALHLPPAMPAKVRLPGNDVAEVTTARGAARTTLLLLIKLVHQSRTDWELAHDGDGSEYLKFVHDLLSRLFDLHRDASAKEFLKQVHRRMS